MLRCELKEGRPRRWFDPPSGNFGLELCSYTVSRACPRLMMMYSPYEVRGQPPPHDTICLTS